MIGKLLKYDFKKMTRVLIYIYIASIVLSALTRFVNIWKDIQAVFILGQVFVGITYSAIGSVLINTFVHILKVFVSSFYKDESYLTHTLPVSKSKLLLSKFISSVLVILCSVVVCFLSLFIMFYSKSFANALIQFVKVAVSGFNLPIGVFVLIFALIIFFQICAIICMAFTAVVMAYRHSEKRILKGLCYFAVFYLGSLVATVICALAVFAVGGMLNQLLASVMTQKAFITLLILAIICYVFYFFIFYFICKKVFEKGVNVD